MSPAGVVGGQGATSPAGGPSGRDGIRRRAWLGLALFAAAVVLPLLREVEVRPWQVVWAEDGSIFWRQAAVDGADALFRSYNGWLHLVPRALAQVAALFPPGWAGGVLAIEGALVAALVATFVHRCTWGWIASEPFRLAVPLVLVLGPAVGWESTANITNVIWVFVAAVPWALVSRRSGRTDVVLRAVVVLLAALSHPMSVVFVPLAALVWWRRRRRDAVVLGVVLLAGLGAQLAVVLSAPPRDAVSWTVPEIVRIVATESVGSFLVGNAHRDLWADHGTVFTGVAVLVTAAAFVVAWSGAPRRARELALVLTATAGATAVVPLVANGTEDVRLVAGVTAPTVWRYVVVPVAMLVGALAVLLDPPGRAGQRPVAVVGRLLLALQLVVLVVVGFRVEGARSASLQWVPQLDAAYAACADPDSPPDLLVSIGTAPPGWGVHLRCSELPPR